MHLSSTTDKLSERYGSVEQAVRALADAGFSAFDFSIFDALSNPIFGDERLSCLAALKSCARDAGIVCNQAHAPFPTLLPEGRYSSEYEHYNEMIFDRLVLSVQAAAYLGASNIIVHPITHLPYRANAAYLKELNLELFRALAPHAREAGIRLCLENLLDCTQPDRGPSCCGTPASYLDFLDALDEPELFGACLDTGHCLLAGEDCADFIRALGPRLVALHLNDNNGLDDQHLMPTLGLNDWPRIMQALSDIGYQGDLTLECDNTLRRYPTHRLPEAERLFHDTLLSLAAMMS